MIITRKLFNNESPPDLTYIQNMFNITEIIIMFKGFVILYKNFRIPCTRTWTIRKKHKMIIIRQIKYVSVSNGRGRHEKFWGISCEKSRFYAKKSYFFQF